MKDINENLNDTKYLLEETECKNTNNNLCDQSFKNTLLNNTQLLLEDKSSIIYDIPNDNLNNINQNQIKKETIKKEKELKPEQENSIKDILVQSVNNDYNEEKEKIKDEQEIIKQQNILLNNQSSHFEELFSLSNTDILHNKKNNKNKYIDYKQIYLGVLFPTEKIIKNISYKNDDKKKIICFQIKKNNNDNNDEQYFKILIDQNKNYFNLKSNEEINLKISLEAPFIKRKKQIKCDIEVIDINNCLIDTLHLYANIEIPKFCCLRYNNINNFNIKEYNIPLIQIKYNLNNNYNKDNYQKFKIPIKNLTTKDLKINLDIISNPNDKKIYKEFVDCEVFLDKEKMVTFSSLDINYIEILLKIIIKKDLNNNNIKIKKILEANIIDTKINYYFFLEIMIVNI